MALIACPDCPTLVSDRAPTCPKCGAPIAGRGEAVASGAALTTIQETSKRLKGQILMASLCFWVGLIWVFASAGQPDSPLSTGFPRLLCFAGLIWYIVTRFRIWGHHK